MMKGFLYPESVAVFGVSNVPSNLGNVIIGNLERFGYAGRVYPVGASGGAIDGRRIYADVSELPEAPELAVLLIPAREVPGTLDACGKKGIRHVIVESGGFSELADEKKAQEEEVLEIARRRGVKVIGPNCFGVVNMENGLILPFFVLNPAYLRPGHVSLISQSGGIVYDSLMLCSAENIGLNKIVSIGNKLLTDENDALEFLIHDPGTHVIAMYLESFSDGRRLMDLTLSTDKPVIVLKANRTPAGEEIARFHTTALAGDDATADAALRQAGVHRVQNFREMIDCAMAFSLPTLKGRSLALITRSGGHGVLAADAAYRHGFELARLSPQFFEKVKTRRRAHVIRPTNPVDVGDVYDLDHYRDILDLVLDEPGVDGVVFIATFSSETEGEKIHRFIRHAAGASGVSGKPVVLCMVSNREQWFDFKVAADYPIFSELDDAMKALARCRDHQAGKPRIPATPYGVAFPRRPDRAGVRKLLDPNEAFALLTPLGLPSPEHALVRNAAEGIAAAGRMGYPVALKTASPVTLHKTEKGGVTLNIDGPGALQSAFDTMKVEAYLIQKMVPPGIELIIGGRHDPEFGPVVLFGLGGVYVELLRDVAIRAAPVDETTAHGMIEEIRGGALLKGFRGQLPTGRQALVAALVNVSRLLVERPEITAIDINPFVVFREGEGGLVVDVKVETATLVPAPLTG